MAKKSTTAAASDRQAKIQAAQKSQGSGANRIVVATVVVVVAIIAVVGGVVWSQNQKEAATGTSTAVPAGASMGKGYPAFANVTAAAGAPTVDLYEDFQCPICAQFEAALGSTFQGLAQEGKLKLNYHVLNFLDDKTGAKNSTPAANGAFCAAADGKFQEFHNAIFANQVAEGQDVTDAELGAWAATAGLTGDALTTWQKCVADGTYTKYVTSVNEAAFKIPSFQGTPTVMINGEVVDLNTIKSPELLTQAIQNATK
ncbi:MAG TPA: thioredoxin domain-containing protein [Ornithinibacter sp.]|nr:thioredoxin domain-containing protein [Ornithinibacter sp.]